MKAKIQRLKRLEEIIAFTDEGKVVLEGNDSPTDIQIGQAMRKYARQFAVAKKIDKNSSFKLNRPHPKIGAEKGTILTKAEWMDQYSMDEQMFNVVRSSGYLMQLR